MLNKITIELEIPAEPDEDSAEILETQTSFLVRTWKAVLTDFKKAGIEVPGISYRSAKKKEAVAEETKTERTQFIKALLDHQLKHFPKTNVAEQMKAIKALYETGRTSEELINLYEQSRQSYALTTWHTVKYKLGKMTPEVVDTVDLPENVVSSIKERYSN